MTELLRNRKIVVGVTGGIAAFKAAEIVSRLKKAGAEVRVIMTRGAENFITPLTMQELSKNPVMVSMWEKVTQWDVEHIAVAQWADMFLIAPATANIIGRVAGGIADDMLTTAIMATEAPVFFAPAMNTQMYKNPIVTDNMAKLHQYGYQFIEPAAGMLACGTSGVGRLPEPADIVAKAGEYFASLSRFAGKTVLVTAAGTREPIDPVRYIGNRSSGKMGYAVAVSAARQGARVILVSGPSVLSRPDNVEFIGVESAAQMREAVLKYYPETDIVIKAAAVADYRAVEVSENKIKKSEEQLTLQLQKNPDILKELGEKKQTGQFLVGFAAETQNLLQYASDKMKRKNLDMLVANDVTMQNAGFNTDTNIVKLLYRDGTVEDIPKMTKIDLAELILDKIAEKCHI